MYEKKHALSNKKIHTPKGIARLTVTAATMAAMTGSSLISPFTAFAQTGDGGTQHPAVMSPIAAHAGAASGTGAKSAAQTIADLQKAVDEAKTKEDAADAGAAIASGHDVNADDALNALFAAAVEARAKVAPAKAILDEKQAAVDGLQSGYDAALAAYELAKSDRIAAEQKLSDEIARQKAEEAAKQQAAYTPKHLAGTDTAQPGSLAQTGDRAGLIGETFVIGGTVLVAAGVFLDQKKRREQM